jgi:hypothetical protein
MMLDSMDTTTTERLKQTVGTTQVIGNEKYGPARLVGGVTDVEDDLSRGPSGIF